MKYPLEKAYRLISPRLVILVTTVNSKQGVNAAPISFCSPISFSPPIVMISLTPEIRTHKNIQETKEFVINILSKQYADQVLRCAARYPEGVNKLEVVGLKKFSSILVKPPRVKEAFAWLECKLIEEKKFGDHFAIFGEVLTAEIKDEIAKEGEIDFSKVSPILHLFKEYFAFDFKVVKQKRYD
ncbi:MAG: flavin reductase family protein [Candidatus Aenigmatarchaeota archaeon]